MNLLDRALEIAPDNAACRFYRARLLYEMRDYKTCRTALNDLKLFAHDEAQVIWSQQKTLYSYDRKMFSNNFFVFRSSFYLVESTRS